MKLTENFHLEELIESQYAARNGFDNDPSEDVINKLRDLCIHVLQPLRDIVDKPVIISSGYRCPRVNTGIGGARNSQHIKGEAADIMIPGMSTLDVIKIIVKTGIKFDQVIEEFGQWVHVSYNAEENRGRIFQAYKLDNMTRYKILEV